MLAVVLVWLGVSVFQPGHGKGHGRVDVAIPARSSTSQIGSILSKDGVVSSGLFFRLRAVLSGRRSDLHSGHFVMARDMSYAAAIDVLAAKPVVPKVVKVTIPEGKSRHEIATIAEDDGLTGSYLTASARSPALSPRHFGAPRATSSLEGFLFPATYQLPGGAPASRLVAEQLAAFKLNLSHVRLAAARRKHLTPYDVLIIASMVEREAQVARERPLIAAVIYNRLHRRIPLGIDATTRYELNNWTRPLTNADLARNTPYNTRRRRGLPPTPIGNPGLASIKAAARPAGVPYLYYVVRPGSCGTHAFSSTAAQFQRDVASYNSARARSGGRSPTRC
jgi:uncharacterized YceG family protein